MSEKKELSQEQLEKVNGGNHYRSVDDIKWLFTNDAKAYIELTDGVKVEGKVTKRGFWGLPWAGLFDLYYVESTENINVNGWYLGDDFSNKTVSISKKYQGMAEISVVDW